jgi:hypothetical protein
VFSNGRAGRLSVWSAVTNGWSKAPSCCCAHMAAGLGVAKEFPNGYFYFSTGVNLKMMVGPWRLELQTSTVSKAN